MSEKIFIQEDNNQREATPEEALQIQKDIAELQALEQSIREDREAKAVAKASALAKLAALGLTEEEIAAL
jgi:hypothetical protein